MINLCAIVFFFFQESLWLQDGEKTEGGEKETN